MFNPAAEYQKNTIFPAPGKENLHGFTPPLPSRTEKSQDVSEKKSQPYDYEGVMFRLIP